jgi:uncharacterized protein
MRGRGHGARDSFRSILTLTAVPLAGLALFFFWNWLHDGITPAETAGEVVRATTRGGVLPSSVGPLPFAATRTVGPPSPASAGNTPPENAAELPDEETIARVTVGEAGRIVLIIDDLGFEGQPLERIMALDPNINGSILPNAPRASQTAMILHAAGFEVLCHLPMEPQGRESPGRNAILTTMADDEIERVTRDHIAAVPHARGVNNHMGSRATADRRVMQSVLRAFPEGMYFIDSRTTGRSVAAAVARETDVRTATRHVFLDDVLTEAAVRAQLAELAAVARKKGTAIGIGHPHAVTLRVLAEELPSLREQGFRLVRASEVVQ